MVGSVRGSPQSRWTEYEHLSWARRAHALDIVLGGRRESTVEGVSPTCRAEWKLYGIPLSVRRVHENGHAEDVPPSGTRARFHRRIPNPPPTSTLLERCRRIEGVAERLFEGEEAVLHVMGWVGRRRQRGRFVDAVC
jgi:hypothetical protein